MSDWLRDLFGRLGEVPCDVCGTRRPPAELTETIIPAKVLDFGVPGLRAAGPDPVVVHRLAFVCAAGCPVPPPVGGAGDG